MLTQIVEYLAQNRAILVGAAVTLSELLVILVNTIRKLRAQKQAQVSYGLRMEDPYTPGLPQPSLRRMLFWAANPLNLFRRA